MHSYDGRCAQLRRSVCTVGDSTDGHGRAAPAACRGLNHSSAGRLKDVTSGEGQCGRTCGLRVRCSVRGFPATTCAFARVPAKMCP